MRPTYRLIQVLRGLAALMVVAHHATILLIERDHLPVGNWLAGSSGVDLFFVISGFVMTVSSAPLRSVQHPARIFLVRRLERIVPLYWIFTTLKLLLLLLAPALALNSFGSWQHAVASYMFFPWPSSTGRFEPLVVVGWTLNFEMLFYLLFAATLALRWRTALVLSPLLLLPCAPVRWVVSLPYPLWFYYSTVLWEFAFGMALGLAVYRIRRWPWWTGLPMVVIGLIPLFTWDAPGLGYWRGLQWGVPALAVVAGALVLEKRWGARSPRWALELGDASYSVYLVHTFVLPGIGLWIALWPHSRYEYLIAICTCLALSALAGVLVYRVVELPIMRWFKGRRRTAVPANA